MVTTVDTYMDQLCEAFPTVPRGDIKKIVEYGWRKLYYYNLRGCDTVISSTKHKFWFYIGELTCNSFKHYAYYIRMLRRKLRVLYEKKVKEWDGYYYIGLTEDEYEYLLKGLNQKGRKKKYYTFNNKVSIKVFDESKLYYCWSKCIIKYKYPVDLGYSFYRKNFSYEYPEIALERDKPAKFKDILISNNNYELL